MGDFLSHLTAGVRRLNEIKSELTSLEFQELLLEQKSLLIDAKAEIIHLREEYIELERKLNAELAAKSKSRELVEVEGFKYDLDGSGFPANLPYCPTCEVSHDGKLYRLNRLNDYYSVCPNCKTDYNVGKSGQVHVSAPVGDPYVGGSYF